MCGAYAFKACGKLFCEAVISFPILSHAAAYAAQPGILKFRQPVHIFSRIFVRPAGGGAQEYKMHCKSAAPPKAKRSFRALRAFNFVNIRAVSCRLPVCNVLNIPHAGKENRKAFFIAADIAVDIAADIAADIGIQKQLMPSLFLNLIPAASSNATQADKSDRLPAHIVKRVRCRCLPARNKNTVRRYFLI